MSRFDAALALSLGASVMGIITIPCPFFFAYFLGQNLVHHETKACFMHAAACCDPIPAVDGMRSIRS
jgi:hypothetical protein